MNLRATLFDALRLYTPDGARLEKTGSPTTRSLLAYLLLHRQQPADRRRLAFLFWPNATESAASRNLRQYLHHVRQVLAPLDPAGNLLLTTGSSVQINPQAVVWLDVETFQQKTGPEASLPDLQEAVRLYSGDLLQDLYDEWPQPLRQSLRQVFLQSLNRLSQGFLQAGLLAEALEYAQRWQQNDPLDENAVRRLMWIWARRGNRPRALQTYRDFARLLQEELDAPPLPETQALYQAIQRGELPPQETGLPPAPRRKRPTPASFPVHLPDIDIPLVGRSRQLRQAEDRIARAAAGQGGVLLLGGEAGIGKTRFWQTLRLRRGEQLPMLHGLCYELDSMVPFAALRQALHNNPALDSLRSVGLPPETEALLARLQANDAPPADMRAAWGTALLALSQAFPARPLLLVLDDFHWADLPTWELFALLARQAQRYPLLVIGLYRPEDLTAPQRDLLRRMQRSQLAETLQLPPLSTTETADLVAALLPDRADDPIFLQRLQRDTHGNPLFIIETIHALQESGRQMNVVPASIQHIIEARLDRLQEESRSALQAAAVIGRSFSFTLLQEIASLSPQQGVALLEEWQQRGLISESEGGYDFRHDQIRSVAYAQLSQARRQYLHGRIADVLKSAIPQPEAAVLAYHYARSSRPLQALPWLIQAGEQALRLRSYHEAREFGLQAVNLLGQQPGPHLHGERIDIYLQLAQAHAFTGDLPRAIQALNETLAWAHNLGDPLRLGHIYRRLAQFYWLQGEPEAAREHARRALRAAEETGHRGLEMAALRMLGRVSIALAAFDDAIVFLNRHQRLHAHTVNSADLAVGLGYLGVAYARVGAWENAIQAAQQAVQHAERDSSHDLPTPHAVFTRVQLAMVYADRHHWQQCQDTLAPIPLPTEEDDWTPALYMTASLRGLAQAHLGNPQEGSRLLESALAWAQRHQYRVFHYLPLLFLAQSRLLARDFARARQHARRALDESHAANNRWAQALAETLLAEIEQQAPSPNWQQVEARLLRAVQLLREVRARPDLARTYLALRRLYDRAGRIAWAVDCHFRAVVIFDELDMRDELREAQGRPSDRRGGAVLPDLPLRGPSAPPEK